MIDRVDMEKAERKALDLLAGDPQRTFSKQTLAKAIGVESTRTVDRVVNRLRWALEDQGISAIANVWGVGYRYDRVSR